MRGNPNASALAELRANGYEETQISSSDAAATFAQNVSSATAFSPILIYDIGNNMELALVEGALLQLKLVDSGGNDLPRETVIGIYKRNVLERQVQYKIADLIYSPYVGIALPDQQDNEKNVGFALQFKAKLAPRGYIHVAAGWQLVFLLSGTTTQISTSASRIELDCLKKPVAG